jgi:hypothetical protein
MIAMNRDTVATPDPETGMCDNPYCTICERKRKSLNINAAYGKMGRPESIASDIVRGLNQGDLLHWFRINAPNVKFTTDPTASGLLLTADFGYGVKVNRVNVDRDYLERCLRDVGKRHLGG